MRRLLPVLLSILACTAHTEAVTVSGKVRTGIWHSRYNPYRVLDTVVIGRGDTVVIKPGVEMIFDRDVQIIIRGVLIVQGTADSTVTFGPGRAPVWGGLRFLGGASRGYLHHVQVRNAVANKGDWGDYGGALYLDSADVSLIGCSITGNIAEKGGGAICVRRGGSIQMTNCVVSGNAILDNPTGFDGGAMYVDSSTVRAVDCRFLNNLADYEGGALLVRDSCRVNLTRCIIAGNRADGYGAALSVYDSRDVSLINCTVTANRASFNGGAVMLWKPVSHTLIRSSIIWNNVGSRPDSSGQLDRADGTYSVVFSDIQGGWRSQPGNISQDPCLRNDGTYALEPHSPCIDFGNPSDPDDPDGTTVEMGAVYFPQNTVSGHTGTTYWDSTESPYVAVENLVVGPQDTLAIGPGVNVRFQKDAGIRIFGVLLVEGTENDSVRFTPTPTSRARWWKGITFLPGSGGSLRFARFSRARATGYSSENLRGGAIFARNATLDTRNCTFSHNHAHLEGGGLFLTEGTYTLSHCRFIENLSHKAGGGLAGTQTTINLEQCLFAYNTTQQGASTISVDQSRLSIKHCTAIDNASVTGPDSLITGTRSRITIENSIIWHTSTPQVLPRNDSISVSYSCIRGGYPGRGNMSIDPAFTAPDGLDYSLQSTSPLINAGNPDSSPDPDGTRPDMGFIPHDLSNSKRVVSGLQPTSVWTAEGGPVHVNGPLTVQKNDTLRIEPGVTVQFDRDASIDMYGRLEARGAADDSILFIPGVSSQWGGICVHGDTALLSYVRITGGHGAYDSTHSAGALSLCGETAYAELRHSSLYGNASPVFGGAVSVMSGKIDIQDCAFTGNIAQNKGGAVFLTGAATARISTSFFRDNRVMRGGGGAIFAYRSTVQAAECRFTGNSSPHWMGGAADIYYHSAAVFIRCVFDGNSAGRESGALNVSYSSEASITNCTFWKNRAATEGGLERAGAVGFINAGGTVYNSLLYENQPVQIHASESQTVVRYCNIDGGYYGIGNIATHPVLCNPDSGDFTPLITSPCINSGDPDGPRDADSSRADIGAWFFRSRLAVSSRPVPAADTTHIEIRATSLPATAADLVLLLDSLLVDTAYIANCLFENYPGSLCRSEFVGDTLSLHLRTRNPIPMQDSLIATLALVTAPGAEDTIRAGIRWMTERGTNIDGAIPDITGNPLVITPLYGDVDRNGAMTADDSGLILQASVSERAVIPENLADVTMNNTVSAFDAALVLHKTEGDTLVWPPVPGTRPSHSSKKRRSLRFAPANDGWLLLADDATGVCGVDMTMSLPTSAPVTVTGPAHLAARQDGSRLYLSFIRNCSGNEAFFHIDTRNNPPRILDIRLNEGLIPVGEISRPTEFTLGQNTPNPFNATTAITYGVTIEGPVILLIYNAFGQTIRTLVNQTQAPGMYTVTWDRKDEQGYRVMNGTYLYRLITNQGELVRRMVVLR